MLVISEITIDVLNAGNSPRVYATQGDSNSRAVKIHLKSNGQAFSVPEGAVGIVRYSRQNGNGSSYDTTPSGSACVFGESDVTVYLSKNLLAVSGLASVSVDIQAEKSNLHTFVFELMVEKNPGIVQGEDGGYYLAGTLKDSGWEPNKFLGTDAQGKVITKNAPGNSETGGVGNITVEVDTDTMTANYTNTQIIEHLENGGTARVKVSSSGAYFQLYGIVGTTVMFSAPAVNEAEQVELVIYSFWASGSVSKDVFPIGSGESTGKPVSGFKVTEGSGGAFSMEIQFTDGTSDTFWVPAGEKPAQVTYNGVAIPIEWAVSE